MEKPSTDKELTLRESYVYDALVAKEKVDDIAAALGVTRNTVYVDVHKIRSKGYVLHTPTKRKQEGSGLYVTPDPDLVDTDIHWSAMCPRCGCSGTISLDLPHHWYFKHETDGDWIVKIDRRKAATWEDIRWELDEACRQSQIGSSSIP